MKNAAVVVGLALSGAGCVPAAYDTIVMTCSEFVGRPISERIAALGPPQTIIRLSPTQVGYIFDASATTISGGDLYYTTNYLVGVDTHRTPLYRTTTACRGTFVVNAPSDAIPASERIIVDVRP